LLAFCDANNSFLDNFSVVMTEKFSLMIVTNFSMALAELQLEHLINPFEGQAARVFQSSA
jgi:hypothetical protein